LLKWRAHYIVLATVDLAGSLLPLFANETLRNAEPDNSERPATCLN
jgi:hypothetical protein